MSIGNKDDINIEDQLKRLQFVDSHEHEHYGCCSHQHHHHHQQHGGDGGDYRLAKKIKRTYQIEKEFFIDDIKYVEYKDESQMKPIMNLITKDLSEPYSIYTYRYFIHNWPHLSFLVCPSFYVCKCRVHCPLDPR